MSLSMATYGGSREIKTPLVLIKLDQGSQSFSFHNNQQDNSGLNYNENKKNGKYFF